MNLNIFLKFGPEGKNLKNLIKIFNLITITTRCTGFQTLKQANPDPSAAKYIESTKHLSTYAGQACMDTVVNPPRPGEPSYESWKAEVDATIASLKK